MKVELSIEQLEVLHCALVTRHRVVTEDWLPVLKGLEREELLQEMRILPSLQQFICKTKIEGEITERLKVS